MNSSAEHVPECGNVAEAVARVESQSAAPGAVATPPDSELGRSTFTAAAKRLLPLLGVCFFLSYLDRTNVSVAALTMNKALGISATAFGLGAGLFFVGYVIVEVPSNVIMHKVGARRWIARIMISWGVVAAGQALVQGETSFYLARILLGVMEAGFFPGAILYLTLWFPAAQRARVVGLFMLAVPLSTALGAPVSGLLLNLNGVAGLAGWQWLFIVEGVPTVIIGFLVLAWLTDRPEQASWLTPQQRNWLTTTLEAEERQTSSRYSFTTRQTLTNPRVLALSLVYFALVFGLYGLGFWIPTIIKKSLAIQDYFLVTLLSAAPYAVGVIAIIFWGRLVDRRGRPALLTFIPMLIGGLALALTAFGTSMPWLGYGGLFVCVAGIMASFPGFWSLPSVFLAGAAAAVGIAVINAIGNLSGFAGPYWVGWMTDLFGDAKWGLVSIGVVMVIGAIAVLRLGNAPPMAAATPDRRSQPQQHQQPRRDHQLPDPVSVAPEQQQVLLRRGFTLEYTTLACAETQVVWPPSLLCGCALPWDHQIGSSARTPRPLIRQTSTFFWDSHIARLRRTGKARVSERPTRGDNLAAALPPAEPAALNAIQKLLTNRTSATSAMTARTTDM